ncbi:MAG: hypothetical protein FGM46_01700 [Ferruginibacter sp.]|nr:hypothetical protein [Ferruginibacter sp.]
MNTHKINISALCILLVISIAFYQCKSNKPTIAYQQKVEAPFAKHDIPFQEYTFDHDKGIKIERGTGTMIKIEGGSFEKKDGTSVTGSISLKVREFHDPTEIFQSGIPMSQDSLRNNFLQSAGMIELRAFSNGEELNLKNNKSVDVELAGFKPSEGYQLYYLESNKNWIVTDKFMSGENNRKKSKLDKILSFLSKPFKKKEAPEEVIFTLFGNVEEAPYLQNLKSQKWKVSGKNITPEVMEAIRINWDEVKVVALDKKKKRYQLQFTKSVSIDYEKSIIKKISVEASPVLDENNANAQDEFEKELKNYEATLQKMEEEKKRVMLEADMVNSFKINKMGIWNVDKLMSAEGVTEVAVSFDFEKDIDPILNNITLFAIYIDDNSVIKYMPGDWKKVKFQTNKRMKLVAVLPNNTIACVEANVIDAKLKSAENKCHFSTVKSDAGSFFKKQG